MIGVCIVDRLPIVFVLAASSEMVDMGKVTTSSLEIGSIESPLIFDATASNQIQIILVTIFIFMIKKYSNTMLIIISIYTVLPSQLFTIMTNVFVA